MKIPRDLPQFENDKAIFIVTGKQNAAFHLAHKGDLTELAEFNIETPSYSDKEGSSMNRGGGITFGFGWVLERNKPEETKDFLKQLEETSRKILAKQAATKIYLFSPQYILASAKETMKKIAGNKVEMRTFSGNYTRMHPLKLLKELQGRNERRTEKNKPTLIKEEARKILERTKNLKH